MIRPYKESDRYKLIELFLLNTPTYFHMNELKDLESHLDTYAATQFVTEQGGDIVGCGGYHISNDVTVGRLSWYMVHPRFKGKSLGTQLVLHNLQNLRTLPDIKKIEVWTSDKAHAFYAKFGFVLKEHKKDYWAPNMDLYLMEMDK